MEFARRVQYCTVCCIFNSKSTRIELTAQSVPALVLKLVLQRDWKMRPVVFLPGPRPEWSLLLSFPRRHCTSAAQGTEQFAYGSFSFCG